MKISQLSPQPENPRKITPEKLAQLGKTLREYGDLSGVVFNLQTQHLVGGHRRIENMEDAEIVYTKKYAKPTKTGTVAEGYVVSNGERFAYREVRWPLVREKAANIAANKNAGEWDLPQLEVWLKELNSFDVSYDMDLTMFDEEELAGIIGTTVKEHTRVGPTGQDEDDVPEKAPARAKLGDVYRLGRHRLMCGDATKKDDVRKLLKGAEIDMVFTDPPYGMSLDPDWSGSAPAKERMKYLKSGNPKTKAYENVIGDHEDFKPALVDSVFASFPNCEEVFLFGADYYAEIIPGRNTGSWVVWDKRCDESADKMFGSTFELCWSRARHKRETARIRSGIFGVKDDSKSRVHPTQKPVQLPEWFFEKWGKDEDNVADLFGGSGSTLIACEKTDRNCFMMEIDPHYVDVIIERWEKYTGKEAKRVASIKSALKAKAVKSPSPFKGASL